MSKASRGLSLLHYTWLGYDFCKLQCFLIIRLESSFTQTPEVEECYITSILYSLYRWKVSRYGNVLFVCLCSCYCHSVGTSKNHCWLTNRNILTMVFQLSPELKYQLRRNDTLLNCLVNIRQVQIATFLIKIHWYRWKKPSSPSELGQHVHCQIKTGKQ